MNTMFESSPTVVRVLQIIVITSLILLSGLSSCLSLWVMPLLMRAPPKVGAQQFCATVKWGRQYLQTSSRVLGASLITVTFLISRLNDPNESRQWKTWATALAILVPVAPYEIYFIFPINDRIDEIRLELEGKKAEDFSAAQKAELGELLKKWQWRNWGRVTCPLIVGLVALTSITRSV